MDTITYGPFNLKTNKHAENLAEDSMKFFRGLLSGAYGFTEEELNRSWIYDENLPKRLNQLLKPKLLERYIRLRQKSTKQQ